MVMATSSRRSLAYRVTSSYHQAGTQRKVVQQLFSSITITAMSMFSVSCRIKLWDLYSYACLSTFKHSHSSYTHINSVTALSSSSLTSCDDDGYVYLHDVQSNVSSSTRCDDSLVSLALLDGNTVICGSSNGSIVICDVRKLNKKLAEHQVCRGSGIRSIATRSSSSTRNVAIGNDDGVILVYSVNSDLSLSKT
jgi:hypothetical protein